MLSSSYESKVSACDSVRNKSSPSDCFLVVTCLGIFCNNLQLDAYLLKGQPFI